MRPEDDADYFMDGDYTAKSRRYDPRGGQTRPSRGLRLVGQLTVEDDGVAEDCVAGRSIKVGAGARVDNCHVALVDVDENDIGRHERFLDIEEGAHVSNSSCGYMRIGTTSPIEFDSESGTIVEDCHSDNNIEISLFNPGRIERCTAGGAFIVRGLGPGKVTITHPGQIVVQDSPQYRSVDYSDSDAVNFPKDTTIFVSRDHPWHLFFVGDTPGAGFGVASYAEEGRDRIAPQVALMRSILCRPKDGSAGTWIDARNASAWEYIFAQAKAGPDGVLAVDERDMALAVTMHLNP